MTEARIEGVHSTAQRFPTPRPEADGTLEWNATTAVTVTLTCDGNTGVGWTYSSASAQTIIEQHLADVVRGRNAFDVPGGWAAMHRAGRNFGTRGLWMQAMSAVDIAWWDLKARLLAVPLAKLFGGCRDAVPIYGSGGFTTMDDDELARQVEVWRELGCRAMKIKIGEAWGTKVERDLARISRLREFAGDDVELMVDANGAYSVGLARRVGTQLDDLGVAWFEEPVTSDNPAGLGALRTALRCDITAGEYVAEVDDLRPLLPVLDCVQLDVTRCGGYTGFLRCAALAGAAHQQVSAHCAPALHVPVAVAIPNLRHLEYFADHALLEPELVDGAPQVRNGALQHTAAVGHGMKLHA